MSVVDIDDARAVLRAGAVGELLGVAECGWLDVKQGVYRLDNSAPAEELAKDVAAFANSKSGGLLIVGFATKKVHDAEVIDEVRPVPKSLVDLDQHRKVIRERVIPAPRDVRVDWIDGDDGKGILIIDVPAQPPGLLPFAVAGRSATGAASQLSVAVPIREGDATAWLPQREVQRLLAAGWTAMGGPSDQFLGGLIEKAVTAARRQPHDLPRAPVVGDGVAGWKTPFQQAYGSAAESGLSIWTPNSLVQWQGPGVVQYFDDARPGSPGWVLCALPGRRPVAVAEEVWQALQMAGASAPAGDALGAIGFPIPEQQATRVIDGSEPAVDLTGGTWGDGWLVRDEGTGEWRWEPVIRLGMGMTRAANMWNKPAASPQLRLRAAITLPWADASSLTIDSQRRRAVEQFLPESGLTRVAAAIARRRDASLRAGGWKRGPHQNALDWLSYSTAFSMPDGRTALEAKVMLGLPNAMESSVVTCAELRIHDLRAEEERLETASGTPGHVYFRLTLPEVAEAIAVMWQTAAERLPLAITDQPATLGWAGPPATDLRIVAEQDASASWDSHPALDDYIDLSPFGQTDRGQIREMSVTVIAPLVLGPEAMRSQVRAALVYMAQQFGFLEADEDSFGVGESASV